MIKFIKLMLAKRKLKAKVKSYMAFKRTIILPLP